jgi:hypothetical protein
VRIGVAFCIVLFAKVQQESIKGLVEEFVTAICRDTKCDAIGWCFPKSVRDYEEEPGVLNPGVILLARATDEGDPVSELVFPGE